jgi:deoxyribonuclease-4
VQVFVSNPRGWAPSLGDPAQDEAFRDDCRRSGIPVYVHAPYLVNFGSPTETTVNRSVQAVEHAMRRGLALGAKGVVVHAGSASPGAPRRRAGPAAHPPAAAARGGRPAGPRLLVEPTAGGGQALCATVQELEPWFAQLDGHEMLGVCLDTCHAWAAGHDVAVPGGMKKTLDALVKAVGRGRWGWCTPTTARTRSGSSRDRHEAIGQGHIGKDAFAELFRHPATRGRARPGGDPGRRQHAPARHRDALHAARRLIARRAGAVSGCPRPLPAGPARRPAAPGGSSAAPATGRPWLW